MPPVNGEKTVRELFGGRMLPAEPLRPNPGLVFDRYLKIWQDQVSLVNEREPLLRRFVREYKECRDSLAPLLEQIHARLRGLASGPGCGERVLTTQERLTSGLGASHPLENGFCFDNTLGVPCLPGSSIKGLCRQAAKSQADSSGVDALLGSGDEDQATASAGDIVFFAAYPAQWPKLEVDVINCHQPIYYGSDAVVWNGQASTTENGKRKQPVGPREDESPNPVFFLTVAKGTSFIFRCASRSRSTSNVEKVLSLIEEGLATLGIGAKTALGYGVLGSP